MELLIAEKSKDYELLDCGVGEKLERYGEFVLRRPDPQAIFPKSLFDGEWQKADAVYQRKGTTGKWLIGDSSRRPGSRENWKIELEGLTFNLELLPSKHLGVFPEQSSQWSWLEKKIEEKIKHDTNTRMKTNDTNKNSKIRVLNLFAYTGGASMAVARAGAEVVHVDSSKFAVDLAGKNFRDSKLDHLPVRFIVDDVRKFVEREIKRGSKYDVIILDPPVYGKGDKSQIWKIEDDLTPLLTRITKILSKEPLAIVLNGYASIYSHLTYAEILKSVTVDLVGMVTSGEMAIKDSSGKLLPCGIFARWEIK